MIRQIGVAAAICAAMVALLVMVQRPVQAVSTSPGLLISEYVANPSGADNANEWVELIATGYIDFAVNPQSVVFLNNGAATANGWVQGGGISYGFSITSGVVYTGQVIYVGGTTMAPVGYRARQIDTGSENGDRFGNNSASGVLGNGGTNADGIATFARAIESLTDATIPYDAIFFGSGIGTAVVGGGSDGYVLPQNDLYSGGFLQPGSFRVGDVAENRSGRATGVFSPTLGAFSTNRSWTAQSTITEDHRSQVVIENAVALPSVQWRLLSTSVGEGGGTATISATLSLTATGDVTATFATVSGSASAADFGSGGTITFTSGTTETTALVSIVDDSVLESTERFAVVLTGASSNATVGGPFTTTIAILDNEPRFAFTSNGFSAAEDVGSAVITVTTGSAVAVTSTIDYRTWQNSATSIEDYGDVSGTLTFLPGQSVLTFTVPIVDDLLSEKNELVRLQLANPTGTSLGTPVLANLTVSDNDAVAPIRIHDIQGADHVSPYLSQSVSGVAGVVTAKRTAGSIGFFFQDPSPDSNPLTSEGLFVFLGTGGAATLANLRVGDAVVVTGTVGEFRPGGSTNSNLAGSQLSSATVVTTSAGNPLPAATVIGSGGRVPPPTLIHSGDSGSDRGIETDINIFTDSQALDFFESLEGMLVQVNNPLVVGGYDPFGQVWLVPDAGAGLDPARRTSRGGILYSYEQENPFLLQLDDGPIDGVPALPSEITHNDLLAGGGPGGSVVGVVGYDFGRFEIYPTAAVTRTTANTLTRETTRLIGGPNRLTVASFNVANLGATDDQAKFDGLAGAILANLGAADLIALEEVQDNNGAGGGGGTDASLTATRLITTIQGLGGPLYQYRDIAPIDGQDGGEPGGNIRIGFLFRTDRGLAFPDRPGATATTAGSATVGATGIELNFNPVRIDPANSAWISSRKPLVGEFVYNGRKLFVIGNHFVSKGADEGSMGRFQPVVRSSETQRLAQAALVNSFAADLLAQDPSVGLIVLGDLNDFQFSPVLTVTRGSVLTNLVDTLPANDQFTYEFNGQAQVLDHILVSNNLVAASEFDIVHMNAEFPTQVSDHDPSVVRLTIPGQAVLSPTPIPLATATPLPNATPVPNATVTPIPNATPTPGIVPGGVNGRVVHLPVGVQAAATGW